MNLDFSINPKLTKEFILSKVNQETILSHYLGIPISSKKLYLNPFRDDNHPTCGIYKSSSGILYFHDFATNVHYNCFTVVMEKYKCSFHSALKIIASDFHLIDDNITIDTLNNEINYVKTLKNKESSLIQVETKDFSGEELEWWNKYGITSDLLKKFNVYSCKYVFINGNIVAESKQHCPIYGYYGGKIKKDKQTVELWKCYFPKRKEYRFIGNWPSKKLQGYEQLPKKGKLCVITKSMKDVMALCAYGIPACAPNSETVIPSETIINDLTNRFEYVFALWDNDETGVTFINKFKDKFPQLHYLIIPRKYGAKDFSDLRKKYGYDKTKEFIKEYLIWFKGKG